MKIVIQMSEAETLALAAHPPEPGIAKAAGYALDLLAPLLAQYLTPPAQGRREEGGGRADVGATPWPEAPPPTEDYAAPVRDAAPDSTPNLHHAALGDGMLALQRAMAVHARGAYDASALAAPLLAYGDAVVYAVKHFGSLRETLERASPGVPEYKIEDTPNMLSILSAVGVQLPYKWFEEDYSARIPFTSP